MLHGGLSFNEFHHMAQQQSEQQRQFHPHAYIGYIQEYDAETNQVKVIDGLNSNPESEDQPMISAWMPLCTGFAGLANGENPINQDVEQYGIQIAPFGGSAPQEIFGGEQVLVVKLNAEIGHEACAFMLYNDVAIPPGREIRIIGGQLQSGEILYVNPSGTLIYFDVQGNLKIITQAVPDAEQNQTGNIQAVANGGIRLETAEENTAFGDVEQGDIDLLARRDINEEAQRSINLHAIDEDITEDAGRDVTVNAGRDNTTDAGRDITENCQRNIEMAAGVDISMLATNELQATSGANMLLTSGADIEAAATGNLIGTAGANITLTSGAIINVLATGNIEINSQGLIEILAPNVSIGAIGELLQPLITQTFLTLFNAHTHTGVTTGTGTSGPPAAPVLPVFPTVTDVLFAG